MTWPHTVGGRLPNIDRGVGDGLSRCCRCHSTVQVSDLAIAGSIKGNGGAILANGSILAPERSQNSGFGSRETVLYCLTVCDIVNETSNGQPVYLEIRESSKNTFRDQ